MLSGGAQIIRFPQQRVTQQHRQSNVTWGGEWDRDKVADRLGEALARGICPRGGHFEFAMVLRGARVEPVDILNLAVDLLGRGKDFSVLIAWANSRRSGAREFSHWCRESGYAEPACRKRAERAADKLAEYISTVERLLQSA